MDNLAIGDNGPCVNRTDVHSVDCKNVKESEPDDSVGIDQQIEKCDVLPENLEKSSCDITPNDDESTSASGATMSSIGIACSHRPEPTHSNGVNEQSDEKICDKNSKSKAAAGFSFTIDFNEGKTVDNKKYKEIVERFQNRQQQQQEQRRHRRGVSLSKLDDTRTSTTSLNNAGRCSPSIDNAIDVSISVAAKPPLKQKHKNDVETKIDDKNNASNTVQSVKVTLRRCQMQSQPSNLDGKDSSKRHSWSPRSSLNYEASPQLSRHQTVLEEPKKMEKSNNSSFQPKSTTLQRALETTALKQSSVKSPQTLTKLKKSYESSVVVTAPLEYVHHSDDEDSIVSDAGTYTLDGDNYTEEEKERMSIDKLARKNMNLAQDAKRNTISSAQKTENNRKYLNLKMQPQQEILLASNNNNAMKVVSEKQRCKNVLDVSYSQSPLRHVSNKNIDLSTQEQSTTNAAKVAKVSYLDKIKSRVKTIGDRTFHKNKSPSNDGGRKIRSNVESSSQNDDSSSIAVDHGTFTSITACGVLNKFAQLETPTSQQSTKVGNRKNSLTKLQIDSSEYIQPKYNIDEKLLNSYTDYEKAKQSEYQLNIFSTVSSYTSSTAPSPPQTDDDNLSTDDKLLSIKTAPTKNDWIQEWAKNARRRNTLLAATTSGSPPAQHSQKSNASRTITNVKNDDRMSQSYDYAYYHQNESNPNEFGDDVIEDNDDCINRFSRSNLRKSQMSSNGYESTRRPPISPTKIPSPMHTQLRARSSSANRSFRNSNADLDNLETEIYLEKTAAAISSLQKLQRKNNSPQSPLSPMRKTNDFITSPLRNTYEKAIELRPVHLHKRNLSLDVSHGSKKLSPNDYLHSANYDSDGMFDAQFQDQLRKRHTRHNSYENKLIQLNSPKRTSIDQTMLPSQQRALFTEQQRLFNKYLGNNSNEERRSSIGAAAAVQTNSGSPIRRSSSFCNKNNAVITSKSATPIANKKPINRRINPSANVALQKSASSSSFKKIMSSSIPPQPMVKNNNNNNHHYGNDENAKFYVNDEDDLHANDNESNLMYSSDDSDNDATNLTNSSSNKYESDVQPEPPITHTRYNKAFLMRMEQNKQIATSGTNSQSKGVIACPNTPELPRRAVNPRASFRDRTSMPRDSSLSRMKQDIPNLQSTKKVLSQSVSKDSNSSTSSSKQRVLPKYLDISKYKPIQGQNFLKRDESKSTLINRNEIRKSPSAIGLSKADSTRSSGRVKSAGAKPSTPVSTKGNFYIV